MKSALIMSKDTLFVHPASTVCSCQNDACVFVQVSLRNIRFFYMDNCGSIAVNGVNSDMKNAIYKLIKYLENNYDIKVRKVR